MSIVMMIYLAGVVDGLKHFFVVSTFIGVICAFSNSIFHVLEGGKFYKIIPIYTVVVGLFAAIIPSEKTVYLMAGASIAQDIAANPRVLQTMDKVFKVVDSKLDEQLKDKAKGETK